MKIVIFGLTISSSWGNGHATIWRGLVRALVRGGHRVVFFERDVPWYAGARDFTEIPGGELVLYRDWADIAPVARRHLAGAEVGMVTSYCPDGVAAARLILESTASAKTFYDLDTPITLARLEVGDIVDYLPPEGLGEFDLVLSYTGGRALTALRERLGAQRVAPLYGSVDPDFHSPAGRLERYRSDFSYIGTYAADRQAALEALFIDPARMLPRRRFVIAGAQYPQNFPWTDNIFFVRHLPPPEHPAFYSSSRMTLNVTRRAMAEMGYCPSGRFFEAAACGAPIVSDWWEGLDTFFDPWREIIVARDSDQAIAAVEASDEELRRRARLARERTLAEHTAERRVEQLEAALEKARKIVVT